MKKVYSIFAALILTLSLNFPVIAAQQVEELKGQQIQNEQGQQVGTIEEVLISPNGEIEAVVVEKGGFLGMGGEQKRIPWNALKEGENPNTLIYSAGSETAQTTSSAQQNETASRTDQQQSQTQLTQDQQDTAQATAAKQGQQDSQLKDGEIAVQDPATKVKVDQPKAQVQVSQKEPKVDVAQSQPKVTVRQPAPEVSVQVEQPKPEVTVQQPKPKVDVQQQKPNVVVKQQKPEVNVQQQEPEVAVQESEPDVNIRKSDQDAKINFQEQEQGQANVDVQRQGEPKVDVNVVTANQKESQSGSKARINASQAEKMMGKNLVGKNGEVLGTVEDIHLSQNGNTVDYLIIQGNENKMHPVPAELVQTDENQQELTAQIDQQTFAGSPTLNENESLEQLGGQQWSREIESHYGISPAWQEGDSSSQRMDNMNQSPRTNSSHQESRQ